MTRRAWTTSEIRALKRHLSAGLSGIQIAQRLHRTKSSVWSFIKSHGLSDQSRYFSPADLAYVRAHAADPIQSLADALGRSYSSAGQLKARLGLARKQLDYGPKFRAFLLARHAAGWSDAEVAAAWGCQRHTVGDWRARLGIPNNNLSLHRRRRVAAKTRAQCRAAGVASLDEVQNIARRKYARDHGLPEDLRPRQVQMFNFLLRSGPSTRRAIAGGIGMPWRGSRKSLVSNDPEGTYLHNLVNRGLIVDLGRVVKGHGSGHSVHLYTVPLPVAERVLAARSGADAPVGRFPIPQRSAAHAQNVA